MDNVHFIAGSVPLCGRRDALWCTILREAVTCPGCLARLHAEAGPAHPAGAARPAEVLDPKHG
jgi:hypothetical protein